MASRSGGCVIIALATNAATVTNDGGAAELLSRFQFGLTAAFHIIFPALTVGLSLFLACLYGVYWKTRKQVYLDAFRFWRKIFAVGFAIGVVAGIVMTFEFGLNWSRYTYRTGPIIAPIIGWEVLTAFFLEAGFIGIMLYGIDRLRPAMGFFACCMVSLGTLLSTTWILAANSWMQTPAGYREKADGQFVPRNWLTVLFNPSFDFRFAHMLLGALITAALLITGVGAYWVRKNNGQHGVARLSLFTGLATLCALIPIQCFMGSTQGAEMYPRNPGLLTAAQGNWTPTTRWTWLIIPNLGDGDPPFFSYGFPKLGAYFVQNDPSATSLIPGVSSVAPDLRPNLWMTFYSFHLMMAFAMLMLGASLGAAVLAWRGKLMTARRFHTLLLWLAPVSAFAVICGWVTAESGRQPWLVFEKLRTVDAVSRLGTGEAIFTLTVFVLFYLTLLVLFFRYIARTARAGVTTGAE